MKISNLLKELKLTRAAQTELDAVLALPEVVTILERDEREILEARRQLVASLAGLPKKYAAQGVSATKVIATAEAELATAEAKLATAKAAYSAACHTQTVATWHQKEEAFSLKSDLLATADPRLKEFSDHLRNASSFIGVAFKIQPYTARQSAWDGGEVVTGVHTNFDTIRAARDAISEAVSDCEAMRMEAISAVDVAQRLAGWTQRLDHFFSDFQIDVPYIDAAGVRGRNPHGFLIYWTEFSPTHRFFSQKNS